MTARRGFEVYHICHQLVCTCGAAFRWHFWMYKINFLASLLYMQVEGNVIHLVIRIYNHSASFPNALHEPTIQTTRPLYNLAKYQLN